MDDDTLNMLKKAFGMFDNKTGMIETTKLATIFNTLGRLVDNSELDIACQEYDTAKTGKIDFDAFVAIASNFLEEEDDEAMLNELKEAFRLYDKEGSIVDYGWFQDIQMILLHSIGAEGNGYITTQTLREILAALDDKLTALDLDGMIAEIDTDGSGTVDFDEFMEMMTGEE